ncbi:DNA cytosine methyltransferase [uncultured Christiangramia sp.]|uniref:DNA cytosine methyltransferase n=1 Tax=uncultured Christiangramia sp. TaxID=503836 RepID=UPI00260E8406|nr:DNA cytosine methyltransferase [uncultured Christiangramia sp.]
MIGVELFSGAGGLSVGAKLAGITTKLAVEMDKFAAETFAVNHPEAIVLNDDIRNVKNIVVDSQNKSKILFGGPPCQGYSKSNLRTRNTKNENNWLFEEYLRLTKNWTPDWVVLENVYGLLGTENGFFKEKILNGLHQLGYEVDYAVLNAKDFGVPQNRERVFIIGSLHNQKIEFPIPTKADHITVNDAFSDLPDLVNGEKGDWKNYKCKAKSDYSKNLRGGLDRCSNHNVSKNSDIVLDRYSHIPEGGNWKDIPEDLIKTTYKDHTRCHTGIYHRLDKNKPSVVIGNYRKNMLVHPWQNRGLSVREAARLQSFPDDFIFKGFLGNQQQQVGNAVPPLLAKAVFEKIKNQNQ